MNKHTDRDTGLEPIQPLVDYYTREMGPLAGRLMAALSFLVDLEDSYGWQRESRQARDSVHYARLLIAEVLRAVAAAQATQAQPSDPAAGIRSQIEQLLGLDPDQETG